MSQVSIEFILICIVIFMVFNCCGEEDDIFGYYLCDLV